MKMIERTEVGSKTHNDGWYIEPEWLSDIQGELQNTEWGRDLSQEEIEAVIVVLNSMDLLLLN